jgi:hypothetical protein
MDLDDINSISLRKISITGLSPEGQSIGFFERITSYLMTKKMEILMIVLLIIIFVIVICFTNQKDPYLESFKPLISKILEKSGYHMFDQTIPIHIFNSNDRTYTINKQKIYMVTQKPNGERYNRDTLLYVLLHEIAHILSPDEHHTKDFYRVEKRLHSSAVDLGYIRKERLDKTYPCSH